MFDLHKSVLFSFKDLKTEKEEESEETAESAKEKDIDEKAPEPELAPKGNKHSFALMKHVI